MYNFFLLSTLKNKQSTLLPELYTTKQDLKQSNQMKKELLKKHKHNVWNTTGCHKALYVHTLFLFTCTWK